MLAVSLGQSYSVYWLYPLMAGLPVLLRSRRSLAIGLISGAMALPVIFIHFDLSSAIVSLGFSMAVTWLVSAWLVFAVTEQSRRLRDMAITDPLPAPTTGVTWRESRSAIDSWQRYRRCAAMLLIDIDFFKRINDKYGHSMGDTAIKQLVAVISIRIRTVDTLCRFGGEEFVVLLQETEIDSAVRVAEELRALVENIRILPEAI